MCMSTCMCQACVHRKAGIFEGVNFFSDLKVMGSTRVKRIANKYHHQHSAFFERPCGLPTRLMPVHKFHGFGIKKIHIQAV